jgi:hypothetical protein
MSFLSGARSFYRKLPKWLAFLCLLPILAGLIVLSFQTFLGYLQSYDYLRNFPRNHPVAYNVLSRNLGVTLVACGFLGLFLIFIWAALQTEVVALPPEFHIRRQKISSDQSRAATDEEHLRVLLKELDSHQIGWVKSLLAGPRVIAPDILEANSFFGLMNSGLIEYIGPGAQIHARVYQLRPSSADAVREFLKESSASKPGAVASFPQPMPAEPLRVAAPGIRCVLKRENNAVLLIITNTGIAADVRVQLTVDGSPLMNKPDHEAYAQWKADRTANSMRVTQGDLRYLELASYESTDSGARFWKWFVPYLQEGKAKRAEAYYIHPIGLPDWPEEELKAKPEYDLTVGVRVLSEPASDHGVFIGEVILRNDGMTSLDPKWGQPISPEGEKS